MRIDDERDLHGQLEAAFEAITPRPAPVDGAVRRGRAIRVRRRVAVAAGAAAVVAIGVFAVPSLLHRSAALGPATQTGGYTVTVQAPGPHPAPGLIASGTIDGQRWQLTAAKPGTGAPGPGGGQVFTTSGPAFEGEAGSQPGQALAVIGGDPVYFLSLGVGARRGPVRRGPGRCDVCGGAAGQRHRAHAAPGHGVRCPRGRVRRSGRGRGPRCHRVLAARRDRRRDPLQRPDRDGRLRRLAQARAARAGPGFGPDRLGHGQRDRMVGHRLPGPVGHMRPDQRHRGRDSLRAYHFCPGLGLRVLHRGTPVGGGRARAGLGRPGSS